MVKVSAVGAFAEGKASCATRERDSRHFFGRNEFLSGQGGIISPFVFNIGIYDMALFVLFGVLINYADDSTSVISARSSELLYENTRLSTC